MADAVLGATVKVALEKLLSFATNQIGLVKEFKKDLESLKETVVMISAVVDDAEEKQMRHKAINLWLKRLEAVACRAEHVLDEVNYDMLRRTVEGKVSFYSSVTFRLKMAPKLKDINNEFELINKKATALGLQSHLGVSIANYAIVPLSNIRSSREKVSIPGQKVIGREKDEETIVQKLLSRSNEVLKLIPIIGIGGLGKTTLAQSVYNNKQVVDHFGQRIWVCVPEDYSPMNIFKLILESLQKNHVDNMQLDVVVQKVQDNLKDQRYLLVLDDVWSGQPKSSWGEFLGSLQRISKSIENSIIVTTREIPMALIFCPRREDHFSLEKLSGEDCLDIVKETALIYEESLQYFEAIRENIKKICQGIPLVARVIGGLLRGNSPSVWHSILEKGISNMTKHEKDDIQKILKLSFDHLHSPSIKKCFTYCSLFKKDYRMQKKQIIELWMAEGFLQPKPGYDDMEIGNECINSLIGSSLLEEVIDEEGECEFVRMHDLVHDLAQSISKLTKDLKDGKENDRYLVIDSFGEETKTLPKMRMLRTLFLGSGICNDMLITSFKHLHVLRLSKVRSLKFPSSIHKLIHLRYLGISDSNIKVIPKSISKLYHLQTLMIEKCSGVKALPKGMTKLINLRHLHSDKRVSLPPNIGCLTNLQTLENFDISQRNQIKELGYLVNLRGRLTIHNLNGVSSKEEAQEAGLNKKPMNSLSFNWQGEDVNHEEVLEGLQPNPHLQNLHICSFAGNKFPAWFMNMAVCSDQNPALPQRLDKLVSLSIKFCRRCKQLPANLGQLPFLKFLQLYGLDNISCIDLSFYGIDDYNRLSNNIDSCQVPRKIFPTLKRLSVKMMKNLKEWMEYQTANNEIVKMFPKLEELNIIDCPQLSHIPIHYFQSLKHLEISGANFSRISSTVEKDQISKRSPNSAPLRIARIPTSLQSLRIRDCHNVREIPEDLYELHSLRHLQISFCKNLKSLPIPMGLQRLTSLQKLIIMGCHRLTSIPQELLNSCPSLTHLSILYCDRLTSLSADLLNSCVSLQHLKISNLRNLESFPFDLRQSPSLSYLSLWNLPKLMTSPKLEPPLSSHSSSRLRYLEIGGFSDSVEVDWSVLSWSSGPLKELTLIGWPNLVSLPDQLQHLTALKALYISGFREIEALPDWFANLVSLERLWLNNCQRLRYLPSMAAMRSLTKLLYLDISFSRLLEDRCSQSNDPNSEWAKISHIPQIRTHGKDIKSDAVQNDLNRTHFTFLPCIYPKKFSDPLILRH